LGVIGIGIVTGTEFESTQDGLEPSYRINVIPVAASIKYTTGFGLPFYGFIGVTGGININIYWYKYISPYNIVLAVPFVEPSIGIGYNFIPEFGISVFGSLPMMFFQEPHIGITPGIMMEYKF